MRESERREDIGRPRERKCDTCALLSIFHAFKRE